MKGPSASTAVDLLPALAAGSIRSTASSAIIGLFRRLGNVFAFCLGRLARRARPCVWRPCAKTLLEDRAPKNTSPKNAQAGKPAKFKNSPG